MNHQTFERNLHSWDMPGSMLLRVSVLSDLDRVRGSLKQSPMNESRKMSVRAYHSVALSILSLVVILSVSLKYWRNIAKREKLSQKKME